MVVIDDIARDDVPQGHGVRIREKRNESQQTKEEDLISLFKEKAGQYDDNADRQDPLQAGIKRAGPCDVVIV